MTALGIIPPQNIIVKVKLSVQFLTDNLLLGEKDV